MLGIKSAQKREVANRRFRRSVSSDFTQSKKTQLEKKMRYGALYQHQYYQNLTISGRFHCQIFTDLPEDTKTLSSRATKGKFVGEHDINQPLTELHFVCSKIGGELLTTQTLKWCNKVVKQLLPELQHFHFHGLRHTYAFHAHRTWSELQRRTGIIRTFRYQNHIKYLFPRITAYQEKGCFYFRIGCLRIR